MAEAITLREFVNRGRLFPVEATFADLVGWEMLNTSVAMRSDLNRQAFSTGEITIPIDITRRVEQYGGPYFANDQLPMFEQPALDAVGELWEAVLDGRIPMWVYEQIEDDLRYDPWE